MTYRTNSTELAVFNDKKPKKTLWCKIFGCKPTMDIPGTLFAIKLLEEPKRSQLITARGTNAYYSPDDAKDYWIFPGLFATCLSCSNELFFSMKEFSKINRGIVLTNLDYAVFYNKNTIGISKIHEEKVFSINYLFTDENYENSFKVKTKIVDNKIYYVVSGYLTSGEDYILGDYAWQEFKENMGWN